MTGSPSFADMISKIAHDLRSPLTSVQGFSSTLTRRWDRFTDEQKRELVVAIHADSIRMARLVSQIVDYARLDAGKLDLHPAVSDVAALLQRILDELGQLPGIERVRSDISPGTEVWADDERLGHILANLVENAIKHGGEGDVVVSAGIAPDGWTEITVRDEGVGMSEDRLRDVMSGTFAAASEGLGLILVRGLTEAHGGVLTAESETGAGTTFKVRLPPSGPP